MQKSRQAPKSERKTAIRSRGRPRAFDREAALAKATRLFWTKGYEATSISDLTEAMGIGSPSLYAAFGSKEALYAEALRHYRENYESLVWGRFSAADTARDAVEALLLDSAAALTGSACDIPLGCMVTLSSVASEGHADLGTLVRSARNIVRDRLRERLERAVEEGEVLPSVDIHALARFIQSIVHGMSILARDEVTRTELEGVTEVAMAGWDARVSGRSDQH